MKNKNTILSFLPTHLFWDIDVDKLSIKRDKDIIIPRMLFSTTKESFESEISILEKIYSKDDIIESLMQTKERISNEVCSLVADKYAIKPFKRYAI